MIVSTSNYEARWAVNLVTGKKYPEIIKWLDEEKTECLTLALWREVDEEMWDLIFLGKRPFEHDMKSIMFIAEHVNHLLHIDDREMNVRWGRTASLILKRLDDQVVNGNF